MAIYDLVDTALEATTSGATFQSRLRIEIGTSKAAGVEHDKIAEACAELTTAYRNRAQRDILSRIEDAEELVITRKKVNNICNDVSRICRELLGYSIICTVRAKGVFLYSSKEAPKTVIEDSCPIGFALEKKLPITEGMYNTLNEMYNTLQKKCTELESQIVSLKDEIQESENRWISTFKNPNNVFDILTGMITAEELGRSMVSYLKGKGV